SGFILLSIAACAMHFGPFGPSGQPDPTIIETAPRPDFFFLWLYAVLSLLPPSLETPVLLIGPAVALIVLVALPFVSGEGEKSWKRRPIAVLTILLSAVALGTFTNLASHAPWSPMTDAWSSPRYPSDSLLDVRHWSDRGRSFFKVSNAATATRSATAWASVDLR